MGERVHGGGRFVSQAPGERVSLQRAYPPVLGLQMELVVT